MAFTIGTATFTNGSKDVSSVSLTSGKTSYFDTGTRIVVSYNPVIAEVEAVSAPSVNSIRLAENWPHATGTYPFLANMTAEGVVGLAERIRDYIGRVQGETAALVKLYDNTADGIAGTVAGEYFNVLVPSDPDVYSELYLNSNGTAVFQVSMPTKAALDAATQAAQLSESNAATSEQNAAASETKSQEWAENPEDVAVEAGQYSALHWSAKSQSFSTNSADSATLSEKWASEAENIEVEPGLYSALHWAAKAEGFATSINPTVAPTPDTAVQRTNTGAARVADAVNPDEAVVKGQFPAGFDLSGAYAKNNILGTVSQTGGAPTGAIIERGSNANGEYVKYADGTLICLKDAELSYYDSSGLRHTSGWPMSFSASPPSLGLNPYGDAPASGASLANNLFRAFSPSSTSTGTVVYLSDGGVGTFSSGDSLAFTIIAIGRWYN